ncbi:MAG TPA: HAMP domain-containing histidine kinase [Firmicutes bacterium]|nr:HAMP domain-containing histidine kinase [Bacillota bacterium]
MTHPPRPAAMKRRLRHSIAWKLSVGVFLCLFLLLLFNWLLNNFVLVSYYQDVKRHSLETSFANVDALFNGNAEEATEEMYRLYSDENIRMQVWNSYGQIFGPIYSDKSYFSFTLPPLLMENGAYELGVSEDSRTGSHIIYLAGRFTNGYSVVMSTPVAAIEESIGITNQFLLISGGTTLLISLLIILLYARSFTRPIKELSRVAGSVSQLNFSDRYAGRRSDELGDLGRSINAMSAALESAVSELKTANLQLMNDNEQKTRQNEARRAFIANVSHELKTPISLIQTYAEGLKEDIAGDARNRDYYCEVIEDEASKMSVLIKKMTMLMQLEAGNEQLSIERFDISELLYGLLGKHRPRFEEKHAAVTPPPPRPVFVWADEFLMENVLSNYLSNALNHVNEDGRICLDIRPAEKEGRVRISVFNSGRPIPAEELPRIWESFYKVDKARTRAYGGTGIGLSVVAAVMNAHRMPYGVINHEDGVEFYIELESPSGPE